MSDPLYLSAKMVLSELDAWERDRHGVDFNNSPIYRGASLERAIVNLQNAVDAHESIAEFMASDRGGRL